MSSSAGSSTGGPVTTSGAATQGASSTSGPASSGSSGSTGGDTGAEACGGMHPGVESTNFSASLELEDGTPVSFADGTQTLHCTVTDVMYEPVEVVTTTLTMSCPDATLGPLSLTLTTYVSGSDLAAPPPLTSGQPVRVVWGEYANGSSADRAFALFDDVGPSAPPLLAGLRASTIDAQGNRESVWGSDPTLEVIEDNCPEYPDGMVCGTWRPLSLQVSLGPDQAILFSGEADVVGGITTFVSDARLHSPSECTDIPYGDFRILLQATP